MFTNQEIDQLLCSLQEYCNNKKVEYVYSLYDTSYSNRPINPESVCYIIPDYNDLDNIKKLLNNYNVSNECCYGIGEIITISKKI